MWIRQEIQEMLPYAGTLTSGETSELPDTTHQASQYQTYNECTVHITYHTCMCVQPARKQNFPHCHLCEHRSHRVQIIHGAWRSVGSRLCRLLA